MNWVKPTEIGAIQSITSLVGECKCGTRATVRVDSATKHGSRMDYYCPKCAPEKVTASWKAEGFGGIPK
jgi:hypothetical protein